MFDLDPGAANIMPTRYRQVSVAQVRSLAPDDLVEQFTGREAYRRTSFVVARLHNDPWRCALVELARDGSDDLFSRVQAARVLARHEECGYVRDDSLDPGVASQLVRAAEMHPDRRCVVLEGRYRHVSFLLNADPVRVTVVDVVPPMPSKLADQVSRVLDTAEDLPPMVLRERIVDSRSLLPEASALADGLVVPCHGGGVDIEGVTVRHLDERPAFSGSVLLGCERSQQIHRWFYGADAPQTIDWCPRRLIGENLAGEVGGPVLSRCCMLEEGLQHASVQHADVQHADVQNAGIQHQGLQPQGLQHDELQDEGLQHEHSVALVPWGATLTEVHDALRALARSEDTQWTRT